MRLFTLIIFINCVAGMMQLVIVLLIFLCTIAVWWGKKQDWWIAYFLVNLPFSDLSFFDVNERVRFPGASAGSSLLLKEQQNFSHRRINGGSFADKMGFSAASYRDAPSSVSYHTASTKLQDRQIIHNDHQLNSVRGGPLFNWILVISF